MKIKKLIRKTLLSRITEQITHEFCSNSEYDGNDKPIVHDDNETETFELYFWDPDSKWDIQDVYNHMGEALEQMFRVFEL